MSHLFKTMLKNPGKTSYDGKDKDEEILYVVRESLLVYVPKVLFIIILLILPNYLLPYISKAALSGELLFTPDFIFILALFWYTVAIGLTIQLFDNWFFNVFIISTKKIVDFDVVGLSYNNISECTLQNIEDVTSRVKNNFGTVFDIGDVYVQTAAEVREFEFTNVDNPSSIRDIISDLVSNLKQHGTNN